MFSHQGAPDMQFRQAAYGVVSLRGNGHHHPVNKELDNLQLFFNQSLDLLKSGGRLVIIAYHSLEDRMVKEFFSEQSNPCHCG